ncbi:IS21-like element helper ATPase IstB [Marinococcus halotolerans]|uniref:IS21-like element helper ATPase IstB n=1 Tax=Marinococcus halotolerans TaxID=301092 RepID=UPI0003B671E3|nr:IS21-like element helper ATPase IstB [Marinococcus halotolerans]
MNDDLQQLCKTLHLAHLPEGVEKVPFDDPRSFLAGVLRQEVEGRHQARIARLIKKAKFRERKTLEAYEWTDTVQLPATLTQPSLTSLQFIDHQENVILMGSSGTGKTHLATALGQEACQQGKEVRFFQVASLVQQLEEHFRAGTLGKFKRGLDKCDVLILDELGYVPFQKEGAELLFHLITDCYERKSVIVTTNLEFGQWNRIFGDNRLTGALVDRLVHHAHIIAFKGESYRLKHALSHQKSIHSSS